MIGYISDSPVCDPWSPSSYVIYHNFCKGANFFIIPITICLIFFFTKWQNFLGPDFFILIFYHNEDSKNALLMLIINKTLIIEL